MATCGPTNAVQNMKNFTQRDATLQTERVQPVNYIDRGIRSSNAPYGDRHSVQRQFAEFARMDAPEFARDTYTDFLEGSINQPRPPPLHPGLMPPQAMPAPMAGYTNPVRAQINEPDWVSQFQQLSVAEAEIARSQQLQHPPRAFSPQFVHRPLIPQFPNSQFAPAYVQRPQPQQLASDEAFNVAFAEAEASLHRMQEQEAEAQRLQTTREAETRLETETRLEAEADYRSEETRSEEARVQEQREQHSQAEDASDVAGRIIDTLHEHAPELSEKLQNSKFVNLMTRLSTSELKLGQNEFVDAQNVRVDHPDMLANNNDWAPQRPGTRTQNGSQEIRLERRTQPPKGLDDPETYLLKMRKNLDPRVFRKSQYTSPFATATQHSLKTLKSSSWEENYDDW